VFSTSAPYGEWVKKISGGWSSHRHQLWPWIIVAATFLALIAAAAFRSTVSILFEPLETEFGWDRSVVSIAMGVNLFFYGLTAPFAATLMERYSIRRVAAVALGLVAAGSALATVFATPVGLVLSWGVLVGFGTGCLALVFGSMVASRWFHSNRGLITGVFSAAYATGSLIFLPLLSMLVTREGWRVTAWTVAAISLVIMAIFAALFRDRPSQVGIRPFGMPSDYDAPADKGPISVRENFALLWSVSRTRPFLFLAGTFFVCGWTTNGLIGAHFIPATHDHGMPVTTAAGLLALIGIFDFVGTILSGWLTDRFNPVILLGFYYGLRGLALFAVPFLLGPTVEPPMMFFVVFYGLDWIATVPPTIELCRRYFGVAKSGVVFGWVFASHMVGAAVASVFAGLIRDAQGSYFIAWITAAVLCVVATIGILTLRGDSQAQGARKARTS